MTNHEDETRQEAFELTGMEGIRIMVGPGDRTEVIRTAMVDLKTTINGCYRCQGVFWAAWTEYRRDEKISRATYRLRQQAGIPYCR